MLEEQKRANMPAALYCLLSAYCLEAAALTMNTVVFFGVINDGGACYTAAELARYVSSHDRPASCCRVCSIKLLLVGFLQFLRSSQVALPVMHSVPEACAGPLVTYSDMTACYKCIKKSIERRCTANHS